MGKKNIFLITHDRLLLHLPLVGFRYIERSFVFSIVCSPFANANDSKGLIWPSCHAGRKRGIICLKDGLIL